MRRDPGQNLDPLLDTMANVVGILVVLVAVTQLSIGDAVERISDRGAERVASPDELARASAEQEEIEAAVVAAEGELAAYEATAERRGWLSEAMREHLESMEALEGRDLPVVRDVDALSDQIERDRARVSELAAEAQGERERLAALDKLVRDVPPEPRPKVARLPDPRPPREGAKRVVFVARYGRVLFLDLDGAFRELQAGVVDALGDNRAVTSDDGPWLQNLFAKRAIGSGNFFWSVRETDHGTVFADLKWYDERAGVSGEELRAGSPLFEERLAQFDPRSHYLRFYVWSDSYDTYLEARYQAEALGWDVGWMAADREHEVGVDLVRPTVRAFYID